MALPVVASRVTGCVDAVEDGRTGTLVPPRAPAPLAAALSAYVADRELRRRHGAAARERAHRFERRLVWEALAQVYEELS